jgi:hypothetical protein
VKNKIKCYERIFSIKSEKYLFTSTIELTARGGNGNEMVP